jgi:GAF domain-containing protein
MWQLLRVDSIQLDWTSVQSNVLADEIRSGTGADTAVIYLLLPGNGELRAIAAQAAIQTRVKKASVTVGYAMSHWIDTLVGPAQGRVAEGPFLDRFPEAMQYRLKQQAIFPLRLGELLGVMTIGRTSGMRFSRDEMETAVRAARRLATALGRDSRRHEVSERIWIQRAVEILRRAQAEGPLCAAGERFTMSHIAKEVAGA